MSESDIEYQRVLAGLESSSPAERHRWAENLPHRRDMLTDEQAISLARKLTDLIVRQPTDGNRSSYIHALGDLSAWEQVPDDAIGRLRALDTSVLEPWERVQFDRIVDPQD